MRHPENENAAPTGIGNGVNQNINVYNPTFTYRESLGVRRICQAYGVSPQVAAVVVELSGAGVLHE